MNQIKETLEIKDVSKFYSGASGAKLTVLENINSTFELNSKDGSVISLLAPFGAGKSTLLKILAALEKPSTGKVYFNGKEYSETGGKIIYIPEKPSSFPWLNVKSNIKFALSLSKEKNYSLDELISISGLTGYENHFPNEKSLGFRLRISIARALAVNPTLILLDDPFKSMHHETKKEIIWLINNIKEKFKINFLLATTNLSESVNLADRILLMKKNPGHIFSEVNIERNKIDSKDKNYIILLRSEIENAYSKFEGTPLISEIK